MLIVYNYLLISTATLVPISTSLSFFIIAVFIYNPIHGSKGAAVPASRVLMEFKHKYHSFSCYTPKGLIYYMITICYEKIMKIFIIVSK